MLRILFKIYYLLNVEILQRNTAVFSILHSLIRLITSARNFHGAKSQKLNCLKQFRDVILKFSVSGTFFSEKEILNLYTMILVSFGLGWYADEVTLNRTDYQR